MNTNQHEILLHYQHLIFERPPFQIAGDTTLGAITSLNEFILHYQQNGLNNVLIFVEIEFHLNENVECHFM
jgi:hypothetical protein